MRIAHIEAGRHLYGGAAQVRYLLGGLSARGVENVLLAPDGSALAASAPAAEVRALPMRGELDVTLLPRLVRALRTLNPDLVHVHSRRGADLYGGLAAAIAGVPAVLTRRVDSPEPVWLGRWKYRPYATVVALSHAIEAQLLASGVDAARITRIGSGVDTARYRPDATVRDRLVAAFDLPRDAFIVGVVAQLIERKGHAALLEHLPALTRTHPQVRVLCFGRGPLAPALRAAIAVRGLDRHVVLAGFRDDFPELLPGLDVLAHPAVREGLGLALLEAASVGVPVVAIRAGGVPDAVVHGRTGLLVPDAPALVEALATLLATPHDRARLGAEARAHAEQHLDVAQLVGAHVALYDRLLAAGGARVSPPVAP